MYLSIYTSLPLNPENQEFIQWALIKHLPYAGIGLHDLEMS